MLRFLQNNKNIDAYFYIKIFSLLFYIFFISYICPTLSATLEKGNDFMCYYKAIQFLHEYPLQKLYDIDTFLKYDLSYLPNSNYGWFYPPFYVFHIYIFGLLPFKFANFFFITTGFSLFIVAIYFSCQKNIELTQKIAFYIFITPIAILSLIVGQNSFYTASFLLIGLNFLDKRPILSGLSFALLAYKPQFIIIIPFILLLTKNYKTLIWSGIFIVLQCILSIMIFGFEPWVMFFKTLGLVEALIVSDLLPFDLMASIYSFCINFGVTLPIAKIISYIWCGMISCIGSYIFYIRKGDDLAKAILISSICLATPYIFYYDTIILSVSVIFLLKHKNFELSKSDINRIIYLIFSYVILLVLSNNMNISLLFIFCVLSFFNMILYLKYYKIKTSAN